MTSYLFLAHLIGWEWNHIEISSIWLDNNDIMFNCRHHWQHHHPMKYCLLVFLCILHASIQIRQAVPVMKTDIHFLSDYLIKRLKKNIDICCQFNIRHYIISLPWTLIYLHLTTFWENPSLERSMINLGYSRILLSLSYDFIIHYQWVRGPNTTWCWPWATQIYHSLSGLLLD